MLAAVEFRLLLGSNCVMLKSHLEGTSSHNVIPDQNARQKVIQMGKSVECSATHYGEFIPGAVDQMEGPLPTTSPVAFVVHLTLCDWFMISPANQNRVSCRTREERGKKKVLPYISLSGAVAGKGPLVEIQLISTGVAIYSS
ncbi:uncharacterized protein H6S33_000246 [Morchella sextelata]|uniref:uncharacterized protein n=1 Tax=Morchella sextelata TaxID=1174677 RepID=UPI001D0544A9|nr:uncharacterized protein H6S33_000246 [Morchella sextelata]KAH0614610.1 hypothetical protein H6S33_000246 [Morchella sextelata]